jgi:hypothetical protein
MANNSQNAFVDVKNARLMAEIRKEFTQEGWRKFGNTLAKVLDAVQSDKRGRKALRVLMEAGCNPAVVLKELLLYCGPDLGVLALWEKKSKYAKTQLGTISAQLERDARVIESIARDVLEDDYPTYAVAFHIPDTLRQTANSLRSVLDALKRHTHGKTGMTKHLVYLSYHITAATNRPHYKEIASLVASLVCDNSCDVVPLAEAIRRAIKRHEQEDSEFFAGERSNILNHLDQWRRRVSSDNADIR